MDVFKEWTSKRPWKERKNAKKAREGIGSQLVPGIQDPELIFYGQHSGVIGLSRTELYKIACDSEVLKCGYDKVDCILVLYLRKSSYAPV